MSVLADDDVVVRGDAERRRRGPTIIALSRGL